MGGSAEDVGSGKGVGEVVRRVPGRVRESSGVDDVSCWLAICNILQ